MADILSATDYIGLNVIDIEDWLDCDDAKKTRILNVAKNTLETVFPTLIISDRAIYEFCPVLASAYNDTNKMNGQGVSTFSVQGVGSFTFRTPKELEELIPSSAIAIISKENNVPLTPTKSGGKATLKYSG